MRRSGCDPPAWDVRRFVFCRKVSGGSATRVATTLAQGIDDNDRCRNQDTDDDGSDKKNNVPAHGNLLWATFGRLYFG
jgi:hypothetical protein